MYRALTYVCEVFLAQGGATVSQSCAVSYWTVRSPCGVSTHRRRRVNAACAEWYDMQEGERLDSDRASSGC